MTKKNAKLASLQRVEEIQYHLVHGKRLYPCAAIKHCHAYIRYIHFANSPKLGISTKTYVVGTQKNHLCVVGTQKNRLTETVLLSIQNIWSN